MVWNLKQANILKGRNYYMTEYPTPQESSQSICCENRLAGLCIIKTSMKKSNSFGILILIFTGEFVKPSSRTLVGLK